MRNLDINTLEASKNYISQYQIKNGKSPSYRVIDKEFHFNSLAKVQRYMNWLTRNGWVEKADLGGISIPQNLKLGETTKAPVVGAIACGSPILAIENIEAVVELPTFFFGSGEHRIYKAKGDSMIGVGIYDGDWIIAKPSSTAKVGDIVVAIVEDSATVKTYKRTKDKIILHPENPDFDDIIVDECEIQGIVKQVIHNV